MSSSPSPHPRRVMAGRTDWKYWSEVKIKVMNLPPKASTLDLYNCFADKGEIIRIEVKPFSANQSQAYVSFSPAPSWPFWESECWVKDRSGASKKLRIDLLGPPRQFTIQSPGDARRSYPEVMNVSSRKLQFGFMYSGSEMMTMKEIDAGGGGRGASSSNIKDIRVSVNLQRREMYIRFWMTMWNDKRMENVDQEFRFRLSLSQMDEVFEGTRGLGVGSHRVTQKTWTIPLPLPPLCYRKVDANTTHKPEQTLWNENQTWYRETDVTNNRSLLKTSPIALRKTEPVVDIGRWTVLRLEFDLVGTNGHKYNTMRQALIDWNIKFNEDKIVTTISRQPCQFWEMLDTDRENSPTSMAYPKGLFQQPIRLEFPVRYQLEVCLSNGIFNEYNITQAFMEHLAGMDPNRATNILEKAAENANNHFFDPMDIFNLPLGRKPAQRTIPRYCAYSRSATITPSAIYLSTPTVEISNRVIRDYAPWQDRFLRVRFSDEKHEGKIHGTEGETENEIYSRIWRTLRNGITIGGRSYKFLAFGNSQFREHGAYFFAPLEDAPNPEDIMTPSIIREEMGNFGNIREVARYAARMGQCFSTTRAVQDIDVQVTGEEDVERNGYNFTDGVGRLSMSVAKHIAEDFGLPFAAEDPPSLFQFRLGGCKGVLVIDPHLSGSEVRVRRSQRKFDSANEGLEVIRWSQYAPATLNRQLIIVLEALGVPGAAFIERQREQLSDLTKAMDDEVLAQDLLHKNIDFNMMTLTLADMIASGFMAANDPFTMSVLRLWRSWNTKYLKEKAKIFIKDGAFLLGCVDETATLRGHFNHKRTVPEIFVQVSDPDRQGHYKVVEGICIVARNPSLHPGDIRIVRAVNVPALHHLKNVLVFPQTGDRDLPNMCSGGDLDGDDYVVIWDRSLIPPHGCEPMDFTPPAKTLVDNVRLEDIARFFVEYIKNDSLGRIATNHLALADSEEEGVMSEKCLTLAQLHSTAVDYPKSGIPARMTKDLKAKRYPHFMPSKFRTADKTYHSKKILGQLFDQVQKVDFQPAFDAPFDSRVLSAYTHSEETLIRVADIKQTYDTAVHRIMAQHGIGTEFEVWSVFILDHNNSSRDYQMAEEFGRISAALKERFQNICIEEAGGRDFMSLAPFVAAMYVVTAKQIEHAVSLAEQRTDPVDMPLMSFPWIFSHILGKIAMGDTMVPDFTAQQLTGQRAKKTKNPALTTDDVTEEDKTLMRGERKHNQDLLDLFGDIPSASHQHYKDTLEDVSNMPTEPVSYEDFVNSDGTKTKEDLISLDVKETRPEESKENTKPGEQESVDEKTSLAELPLSSDTNIDEPSTTGNSKNDEDSGRPSIGGPMPIRSKNAVDTRAPTLPPIRHSPSPSKPSTIAEQAYLADVLEFEKSPAPSEDVARNMSAPEPSSPSFNRQLGSRQSPSPSISSPKMTQPTIGRAASSTVGHNAANMPQTGAADTRDIQYLRDVLSPTSSSSEFGSPTLHESFGSSTGAATTMPHQQLLDVLIPGGPKSKPKSMKLSSGTGSLPSGLPLGRRLDSSSIKFQAGPPDAPIVGIDPESMNPEKDTRPRWSETARPAASPGTIHEVLTETITVTDSSSPITIVGGGFAAAEFTAGPMNPPSSLLLPPQIQTSRSPSPRPDSSRSPGFTPLGQRATAPAQTGESVGSSSAATTSAAAAALPPPPTALGRRQELNSQNVDQMPPTVNRNNTASAATQHPGHDREDYIARLRAVQKKKSTSAARKGAASAAVTATSATQSQPTLQAEEPTPASASEPNVESRTQTQTQHEEPAQSATKDDTRGEGEVAEQREVGELEEDEVTLEMKPNSTRSLLSKFVL